MSRSRGQFDRFFGGLRGIVKLAGLGISSGEGVQDHRILAARKLVRALGQFHRFTAITLRGQRGRGQQQSQVVLNFQIVGFDLQRCVIMNNGFVNSAFSQQGAGKVILGVQDARFDL